MTKSIRSVLGLKEKKEEKLKVKSPDDVEMGWFDILKSLKRLSKSKAIDVQIRKMEKHWTPFINDLEKLVKQVQDKYQQLLDPGADAEVKQKNEISEFLDLAEKMITKGKKLGETVDYELYVVADQAKAIQIKAANAVIVFTNEKGEYFARILDKKSGKDTITKMPDIQKNKLLEYLGKNEGIIANNNEVTLSEESITWIDEITRALVEKVGVKKPKKKIKELLKGGLQLAEDLPLLLEAFSKIGFSSMFAEQLNRFKTETEDFDLRGMVKAVLPIETYVKIKEEAFAMLAEDKFSQLSRDQQAAALALMEVYNEGVKFAVLAMDKIEIEMQLAPGSLAAKIEIVDGQSIKQMCEEFNDKYKEAMRIAGYTVLPEVYPFKSSLLEQRNAMLAALPPESKEGTANPKKARIAKRIAELGAVEALPKRENIEDFSVFIKNKFSENYKRFKKLKERLVKESKKADANGCGLLVMSSPPDEKKLGELPIQFKAAYIRVWDGKGQDLLYYVNKVTGECTKITDVKETLDEFDMTVNARKEVVALTEKQLKTITLIAGHTHAREIGMAESAKEFILKAENELKAALDESVYRSYFLKEKPVDDKSHWIQQAGKAFINLKKIVQKIEQLQQQHDALLATATPFEHLEYRAQELDELLIAGSELATVLHQIKENPHLNKLISMRMLEEIVPGRKAISAASEVKKNVMTAITSSDKSLENIMEKLKKIIKEQSEKHELDNSLRRETNIALEKMAELVLSLKHLKDLEKETGEKSSLWTFATNHFFQIMSVMSSLPTILATLNKLSKDEAMLMAVGINDVLKDMMLLSDKLEIQFCLKEGFLTNKLRPMISTYHAEVRNLGYDFKPEDRYPYTVAIADQRKKLVQENLFVFQQKLIHDRMNGVKLPEKKMSEEEEKVKIKAGLFSEIDEHIKKLRSLKARTENAVSQKEIEIKIELLEILKQQEDIKIEDRLKQLRTQRPKDIHLLYEGSTGEMLEKLEFKGSSPQDISNEIEKELAGLKKQRGTTHYIYSMHKAELLEKRITACEKLQVLLENHNVSDALAKLDHFNQFRVLEQHDRWFLNKLKSIEQAIPVEHRTKTILGTVAAKNDPVQAVVVGIEKPPEQKYAVELINRRLAELESAILQTSTKRLKIEVLTALTNELKQPGISLQAAINKVKTGKQAKHAHLMFEGRTGKTIKAAQNMTITKAELIHRLDAEINDLKRQRYSRLHVFSQRRKETGDKHIEVLQKLRTTIKGSDKSVKDIINGLDPKEKSVLQRYDADLLRDFNVFEKVASKQQLRAGG